MESKDEDLIISKLSGISLESEDGCPAKVLLEFFVDPQSGSVVFDKKVPYFKQPREGTKFLEEHVPLSEQTAKTELPPMEDLLQVFKEQSKEVFDLVNPEGQQEPIKVIVSRRRVFKEIWLKGSMNQHWEGVYSSRMNATKQSQGNVEILFVDVERNSSAETPSGALSSGLKFGRMCLDAPSSFGFFTLVSYRIGDYILLLSGEVDCKEEPNKVSPSTTYVELKLYSSHPRYFALDSDERLRLWTAMDLGGYGKLVRGHRNKMKELLDMVSVEKFAVLSNQVRPKPKQLRQKLLQRIEKLWKLCGDVENTTFLAQQLVY